MRKKYWWLVADKPSEQDERLLARTRTLVHGILSIDINNNIAFSSERSTENK
jgi:hypothetical protein